MNEQNQNKLGEQLINILLSDGLSNGLVTIAQTLMNAAMLIEREQHLGVAPHQRSDERDGYANGFKPRGFQTTFGKLDLAVPQVRDSSENFRTSLLEKGSRSDRALSEAEVHWRAFLNSLKDRGVGIPDFIVSDAHSGLRAALKAAFSGTPWQRCQFHLQQNAQDYITKQSLKSLIAAEIKTIFNADSLVHANERLRAFTERWKTDQPKLAEWAEENLPEGFAAFSLPEAHRRKMRTCNGSENLNSQIKRRTRVVGVLPNEDSLERLVTGVLIEISENWETGRAYLKNEIN